MQYMLLIYADESGWTTLSEEEQNGWMAKWGAFTEEVRAKGAFVAADRLQPSSTATIVQVRENADPIVTDGPFVETKEQLGGYFLIEAESIDEALGWAGKIPSGTVEVRPVMPLPVETAAA
jgi:hypothetical protein